MRLEVVLIAKEEARRLWRGLSTTDREDVLQEAAVGALRALPAVRPDGNPRAYLARAARSAAIDYLRWRYRRTETELSLELALQTPSLNKSVVDLVADGERHDRLFDAVASANLTPRQREAVEIALEVRKPSQSWQALAGAVRHIHLSRAREKIRGAW